MIFFEYITNISWLGGNRDFKCDLGYTFVALFLCCLCNRMLVETRFLSLKSVYDVSPWISDFQ